MRDGSKGLIFDIQGHAIHDGPGTRTLVFLSGCPLRCAWCSNPEGMQLRPRLMYKVQNCKDCPSRCVAACPKGAIQLHDPVPPVRFDQVQCTQCETFDCSKVCFRQALLISGRWWSLDELMRVLARDRQYWGRDGGVTLTGGEPLLQSEFTLGVLERCHRAGIGVCVESSGYVPQPVLQEALPFVQWLFVDLKHMDTCKHEDKTGVPNRLILDNIRWLRSTDWAGRIVVRMPIIPGFNDALENANATAKFLQEVGLDEINLLPFHRMGASKYERLGVSYDYAEQPSLAQEDLAHLTAVFRDYDISCYVGANTPF